MANHLPLYGTGKAEFAVFVYKDVAIFDLAQGAEVHGLYRGVIDLEGLVTAANDRHTNSM